MDGLAREATGAVGVFAVLVTRGLLLWILIPLGFTLWLLVFSWTARVCLAAFIGWLDLNLLAALQRVLRFPGSGELPMPRVEFVPLRRLQSVSHRVHLSRDPF
jgi:hypothetical protein